MNTPEICKITISFKSLNGKTENSLTTLVPIEVASGLTSELINWEKEYIMSGEYAREYFKEEAKHKL